MTLLLREIGRFLLEATAWIGLEILIATVPVLIGGAAAARVTRLRLLGVAFAGGVVGAALAVRFSLPLAWAPAVGGRPLPVAWSAAGALAAVVAAVGLSNRERP